VHGLGRSPMTDNDGERGKEIRNAGIIETFEVMTSDFRPMAAIFMVFSVYAWIDEGRGVLASQHEKTSRYPCSLSTHLPLHFLTLLPVNLHPVQPQDSSEFSQSERTDEEDVGDITLCIIFLNTELFRNPTFDFPLRNNSINDTNTSIHWARSAGATKS
jgi:hypothetical protein